MKYTLLATCSPTSSCFLITNSVTLLFESHHFYANAFLGRVMRLYEFFVSFFIIFIFIFIIM